MIATSQMAQSLLLVGGKLQDALGLVKKLFGTAHEIKVDSGQHPDVYHYVPEGKSGLHPIVNIRKIIEEMAFPPSEAPYKVFIIEEAEKMLTWSSNALLKTLEEPREDTYFFLLTDYPKQLLDTIRSRLYPMFFKQQSSEECLDVVPFIERAKNEEWDLLLEELPEEGLGPFLQGMLRLAQSPRQFQQMVSLVAEAQKAKDHHIKDRTIILNCLITLTSQPSLV